MNDSSQDKKQNQLNQERKKERGSKENLQKKERITDSRRKTEKIVLEKDLKDRMKNVKQWFHRVNSDKEKKDFIFDFIHKLTVETDQQPRIIIFFNEKKYLEQMFQEITNDPKFSDIREQFAIYHEDIPIEEREKVKIKFDAKNLNYLLATNLEARGIGFNEVTSVINCDVPKTQKTRQIDVQTYVHRVGRAGRSNKKGVSLIVSSENGEDQIIQQASKLDIGISIYKEFKEIRDHLVYCMNHNKTVGQSVNDQDQSWTSIGLSVEMSSHLLSKGYQYPKPAQIIAVPKILNYKINEDKFYSHISFFGFAYGRGKTLCFLAPLADLLVSTPKMTKWEPQAIIIAHSKDLCLQIGKIVQDVIPESKEYEISYLFKDTDTKSIKGTICIGTPGYIVNILKNIKIDKLKFLIVDESDEVLSNNTKDMQQILNTIYENEVHPGFQFLLNSSSFEEIDFDNLEEIINDGFFNRDHISKEIHYDI